MSELKPCPICNNKEVEITELENVTAGFGVTVNKYFAKCDECGTKTEIYDTYIDNSNICKEKVKNDWNNNKVKKGKFKKTNSKNVKIELQFEENKIVLSISEERAIDILKFLGRDKLIRDIKKGEK